MPEDLILMQPELLRILAYGATVDRMDNSAKILDDSPNLLIMEILALNNNLDGLCLLINGVDTDLAVLDSVRLAQSLGEVDNIRLVRLKYIKDKDTDFVTLKLLDHNNTSLGDSRDAGVFKGFGKIEISDSINER